MNKLKYFGTKKIQGRIVKIYEIETIRKRITDSGSSGHVLVPKMYARDKREVEVKILTPEPFVCGGCLDAISQEYMFSPHPKLCKYCNKTEEDLKKIGKNNLKCKSCKKKITEEEFRQVWGREICQSCWDEEEEKNKELWNQKNLII